MSRLQSTVAAAVAAGSLVLTGCTDAPPELVTRPAPSPVAAETRDAHGNPAARADATDLVLKDARLTESSGLAASVEHPGYLYTHNDFGHGPEIFAVGPNGHTAAVLRLAGAGSLDWEDIAVTPDGRIWVADIGDNEAVRRSVSVYVASEPARLVDGDLPWRRYVFRYEDGPRNAEALMVHPTSRQLYIVSKRSGRGGIYTSPQPPSEEEVNVLTQVSESPPNITAAAFSPDGTQFVVRTSRSAYAYSGIGTRPWALRVPAARQGESVTFTLDGTAVLVGSEGPLSPVIRVRLPPALTPSQTEEPRR